LALNKRKEKNLSIDRYVEMGAGKNTTEFFKRRDAWMKHPMICLSEFTKENPAG